MLFYLLLAFYLGYACFFSCLISLFSSYFVDPRTILLYFPLTCVVASAVVLDYISVLCIFTYLHAIDIPARFQLC